MELDSSSIKAALAGEEPPKADGDDIDPVTAAGRRLMERRKWSKADLEDLMAMIEGARE